MTDSKRRERNCPRSCGNNAEAARMIAASAILIYADDRGVSGCAACDRRTGSWGDRPRRHPRNRGRSGLPGDDPLGREVGAPLFKMLNGLGARGAVATPQRPESCPILPCQRPRPLPECSCGSRRENVPPGTRRRPVFLLCPGLVARHFKDRVDRFLLRTGDKRAGVHDNDVGVLRVGSEFGPGLRQQPIITSLSTRFLGSEAHKAYLAGAVARKSRMWVFKGHWDDDDQQEQNLLNSSRWVSASLTQPYRLWFRVGFNSGVKDPSQGNRLDYQRLLHEAEEELAAAF